LEDRIEEKRIEIVKQLKTMRRRLESGDNSQLLVWIIPRALACAQRPLRHHPLYGGSGLPIPGAAKPLILAWIRQIKEEGIKSILSFMHDRDVRCYSHIDLGGLDLVDFLSTVGFGETTPMGRPGSQQNGRTH